MPRLPDFTSIGSRPVSTVAAAPAADLSGQIEAQSTGQLGQVLGSVADEAFTQRTNLARAQAANALLDHEIAVKSATQDLADKVNTGEVPYQQAKQQFEDTVTKIQPPQIQYLDPIAQQNLKKGAARTIFTEGLKMNEVVDHAQRNDFKDQFSANLDKLGKLAGMPDANIDDINAKADAFAPLARKAGIPPEIVDKALQDFKDKNWFNNATQVAMQSKDSMPDLKQLAHDLTDSDGFYAGKLDTDKRNAILRSVTNDQLILENRFERLQEKREAAGQRALLQMGTQIASGVPATPQMWDNWQNTVKGTEAAPEFKQYADDEQKVQQVLRKPIDEQLKYVQDKQATLQSQGGSLRDLAQINRLKGAVEQNVKIMQTEPLIFDANRTGTDLSPLTLSQLGDPNANQQISQQIQDRVTTLTAMRKQYGDQVPIRPLLPQEAAQLTSALNTAQPKDAAAIYGALQNATGGDLDAYKGIMQQIAPDAPLKALAGMLSAKQRNLTLATHWFKPNDVAPSGDVATTILEGQRILDASKAEKADDGKPSKALFMPETTQLQNDFAARVRDAFAGRKDAAQTAFQAVQAYYAGKAAQTGRLASGKQDVDSDIMKEAITATLGNVVDFNGRGSVLAPWGMTSGDFQDKAYAALEAAGKAYGLDEAGTTALHNAGLKNIGDGTFYAMQGRNFVKDAQGNPIVVNLNDTSAGPDTTNLRAKSGSAYTDPTKWDKRADGSQKGNGWLGLLRRPDGGVSSEISIGVDLNGKEQDIPLLVPTLTRPEVDKLLTIKTDENFNQNLPASIKQKAIDFARKRIGAGKSPFASPGESP